MPKYRYVDPAKGGKWLGRVHMFYFFCAWNAFAFAAYGWYKSRKANPATENMSSLQKYMYYLNTKADNIKVIKVSGLAKVDSKTVTREEMLGLEQQVDGADQRTGSL